MDRADPYWLATAAIPQARRAGRVAQLAQRAVIGRAAIEQPCDDRAVLRIDINNSEAYSTDRRYRQEEMRSYMSSASQP